MTHTLNAMTDQQVTDRYAKELQKLKTLNQHGRHSAHFQGYPNTLLLKRCRRELERRGLPIPPVNPPAGIQCQQEGQQPAGNESCVSETAQEPVRVERSPSSCRSIVPRQPS